MLDSMRALSKSFVSKILMGLLVISFGIWGVGDILRGGGPSYAAKIDGDVISLGEFSRQASLLARQLEEVGMKNVSKTQIQASAMRQIVQQRLNLLAIRDLGLYVNDTLVAEKIAAIPQFKNKETGKFDRKLYEATLRNNSLSEAAFVGELKKETAAKFLTDTLSMQGVSAPESVVKLEAIVGGETRDAVIFTIPAKDAMDEKNTTAFQKFYDENRDTLYINPERRTFDYVVLTKTDLEALVDHAITDEMVNDLIKAKPELNKQLARIKLRDEQRDSVIRNVSNSIEDELAAGKSLTEALSKAGVKANLRNLTNASADMAKTSTDPLAKTIIEQGFNLGQGEVSGLIATKSGDTLIVSVKSITPAAPKPFAEVKEDVKLRLSKQLAREAAQAKAIGVKEALAKSPNWQAVAEDQKLTTRVISRLGRPNANKSTSDVPAALQQALFEHPVGEVAGPLALANGDQVMALITASHLPAMADTKATLAAPEQQRLNERLSQDIEGRAYQSFGTKHKVTINPAALQTRSTSGGEEE